MKLHPVDAASHQSLWPHALILSLKCSDVSCGAGSIKGPAVKQYFREQSCLSTSEVVSPCPSYCSNTWRSVTVWCTSMIHSDLSGALFLNTTLYAYWLFLFATPNKRLTLSFYRFRMNRVEPALYDFHLAPLAAFFQWRLLVFKPIVLQSMFYYQDYEYMSP